MLAALAVLAACCVTVLGSPSPASAAPRWYEGDIQYSSVINCTSMIQGSPYAEAGVGGFVGFIADPDGGQPIPGQTFYVKVYLAGLGNPCSGSQVATEIKLPAGVTPAITGAAPIKCFANGASLSASQCPQALGAGSAAGFLQIRSPYPNPYLWPVAQGNTFELHVPVVASTTMSNARMDSRLTVLDGYSDPVLTPSVGLYVYPPGSGGGSVPVIEHPNPSTTGITPTAAKSTAYLFTKGVGGNAFFDLGTSPGSYGLYTDGPAAIPAGDTGGFEVWSDWTPFALQPGTTYYWRLRFVTTSGATYFGPQQTFTTTSNGSSMVGTGTAASCTSGALTAALDAAQNRSGAVIRFNCGPAPVTIDLAGSRNVTQSTTIDGGGLVTLRSASGARMLQFIGGTVSTLRGLGLVGGNNASCGGALIVAGGVRVNVESSRITGNRGGSGGGACVLAGGTLQLWKSSVSGNTASGSAGAVANQGTLEVSSSELSGNAAVGDGGAITTSAGSSLDVRFSTLAGNRAGADGATGTRGGAIDALGLVEITTSTFSGNTAGRGGAISSHGAGDVSTNSTTIAANTARAVGAAGSVDAASSVAVKVRNTILDRNLPRNCAADGAARNLTSTGHSLDSANTCGFAASGDRANADAVLGPLAPNGGLTRTHKLLVGSAAIDGGDDPSCFSSDQRGVSSGNSDRLIDGDLDGVAHCDIGAYERQPDGTPGPPRAVSATGGQSTAQVSWQAPLNNGGNAVTGYVVTPYRSGVAQAARAFTTTATSQALGGLAAGSYTFKVQAKNSVGVGAPSPASGAVSVTAPAGPPGTFFVPIVPCRVVDTRQAGGALVAGAERAFQVGGSGAGFAAQGGRAGGCGVPDGAAAVEVSVTAVSPSGNGYFRAWPTGATPPTATFLNYAGRSITNTGAITLAASGTKDLTTKNFGSSAHYVLDVQGYFTTDPSAGSRFVPMVPCRVVDTRQAGGALVADAERAFQVGGSGAGFAAQGGRAGGCGIPDGATAVEASVTAASPSGNGYFRAWPAGAAAPAATFLNYARGQSITNTGAITLAASGTKDLATKNFGSRSHYVIDVQGYYVPAATQPPAGTVFVPIVPCRTVDTRQAGGALAADALRSWQIGGGGAGFAAQGGQAGGCGIPDGVAGVEASVTAVAPSGNGYFRLWPTGASAPSATFLNFTKGQSITNTGAVALAASGTADLTARNFGSRSHYVIDVQGYYVVPPA